MDSGFPCPDVGHQGPSQELGLGVGLKGEHLVAGPAPMGLGLAQPKKVMMGSPPVRGTIVVKCNLIWAGAEGRDLGNPTSGKPNRTRGFTISDGAVSWRAKPHLKELQEIEPTLRKSRQGDNVTLKALNKILGVCPDTPPGLVGSLRLEFTRGGSLDKVAEKFSAPSLGMGGQYKPPNCIAKHKVAIIIPFRNRDEHLKQWLYYLHPILMRQQLDYGVYVINQAGEGVFNRAKLLNAGFVEALKYYDYNCFVFSDVDLVPLDDRNLYRCFDNPRHLAVAMDKFQYSLPYYTYFGGVCSLSKEQYLRINGFPNTFWGWGGEDDDIYNRIVYRGMSISRPNMLIGKYKMIKHDRDLHNEVNPVNPAKVGQTQKTMNQDGLSSLNYQVSGVERHAGYTFITVDIDAPSVK
ncbi:beta-1,4-galactosyltransferase 1-like [Syngnathoides biaculeatus]|uniref:beta-1,4-galactosyltransferase 1-like n=1 Tax=Syngnathoides biaculeatus TaxID=300417 RepID=UPI002ADE7000|nr:beta-1,4-galactosyltransferase 1-like [Syngnathoides biaculeatus]